MWCYGGKLQQQQCSNNADIVAVGLIQIKRELVKM